MQNPRSFRTLEDFFEKVILYGEVAIKSRYLETNVKTATRGPGYDRKSVICTFGKTELYAAFPARIRQFRCVS